MPAWICATCGVQHADTERPPLRCAICEDERQYVGGRPAVDHHGRVGRDRAVVLREEEPDLVGVGVDPPFAIGQRALLVCTPGGNVLWDCVSLLDDAARGGSPSWAGSRRSACRTRTSTRQRGLRRRLRRPYPHPAGRPAWIRRPSPRSNCSKSRPSLSPDSPWPVSADISTARRCCTGQADPAAAVPCSLGTLSRSCADQAG